MLARVLTLALALPWLFLLASPAVGERLPWAPLIGLALVGLGLGLGPRLEGTRLGSLLERTAASDLFAGWRWVLTLGLYLVLRLPLLMGDSLGSDPDAWRVAEVAERVWERHTYSASRLPGYPVFEIGSAPILALGGSLAARLWVGLMGFLGLWAFDRLGRRLGSRVMGFCTLLLMASPLYVINTSTLMDYAVALAGILGSLLALVERRTGWAAALLGLAFGSRVTSAVFGLPMLLWSRLSGQPWRESARFGLLAPLAGVLAFSPAIWAQGWRLLDGPSPSPDPAQASTVFLAATGLAPLLALGVGFGDALRGPGTLGSGVGTPTLNRGLALSGLGLGLVVFLLLPLQAGYLLPTLAAGLLLAGLSLRPAPLLTMLLVTLGSLWVDEGKGSARSELIARAALQERVELVQAVQPPPGSVVVLGGADYTALERSSPTLKAPEDRRWGRALEDPSTGVLYLARIPEQVFDRAQREGRPVLLWRRDLDASIQKKYGYSPVQRGAETLEGARALVASRQSPPSWKAPPRLRAQVRLSGDALRLSGIAGEPVRACLRPAIPAAEARQASGEVALLEKGATSSSLRVELSWKDAQGSTLGERTFVQIRRGGDRRQIDEALDPPEGAALGQLCVELRGEGAEAEIAGLTLSS